MVTKAKPREPESQGTTAHMETRRRTSLAAAASEKSSSPVRTPRKSVRSRTPQIAQKGTDKSFDVAKGLKPDVSKSVTKRTPRTRRLSNMSSEASPARVTRSAKSLVPQESLGESEFDEPSDTQTSTKTSRKKGAGGVNTDSPRSRRLSVKTSGDESARKLIFESSEDDVFELSAKLPSRIEEIRKSAENVGSSLPRIRIRRISNKPPDGENPVSGTSLKDSSKEPSPRASSKKIGIRNSPEKSTPGSPRARKVSEKSIEGAEIPGKLIIDLSEDESTPSSRKGASRKPSEDPPGSPRSRRVSEKPSQDDEIPGKLIMDLSENESIEPSSIVSSRKGTTQKSPGNVIPGSPSSRRASKKFSNVAEMTGKFVVDVSSDDETNAAATQPRKSLDKSNPGSPRSRRLSGNDVEDLLPARKKDKTRKSLEKSTPGSPRARRLPEKSEAMAISSEEETNVLLTTPSPMKDRSRKSLEKSNMGSPRARRLSEKSEAMAVSSEEETNVLLTTPSPMKDRSRKSPEKSNMRSPRARRMSEKSPELRLVKLTMEVSEEEPEPSQALPNQPDRRKSLETSISGTPRPRKLSGSIVESAISDSLSKKLSISEDSESTLVSSKKKNRRRKSSEKSLPDLSRSRRLSEKSINGSNADEDMLKLELSADGNAMDVSFGSTENASPDKKLRDRLVSDLSASIADVSLNSDSVKTKSKRHKKRTKGSVRVDPEGQADDMKAKDNSLQTAESEVTVRRRGGGTIIETRPVFSDDAKYVYLNCGWGVRVFSVETGECVRVFDAFSKGFKVVNCFCWNTLPAALTSDGVFIAWDPRSGKIQQKVRMHVKSTEMVVDGFFIPCEESAPLLCLVIEFKEHTNLRMYSGSNFRSLAAHPLNARKVAHPYKQHSLSVGGDPGHPFIAYINSKKGIRVVNMKNKTFFRNSNPPDKYWNCIRAHPTEDTLAAGDSIGRIVVFRHLSSSHPGKSSSVNSVYHWHTLPVSEIAFTPAGSSMYSGGGELTLVKWNVENPQVRNFLPRMSADIVHIAISPYNQMVAVATVDNGVQIVTPTNKLQCILQQFSWSVIATEQERMFPSGLLYDPRSRGLILNSRPGHLQLYSPHSETLTYNIDVTMTNYLTQERNKVIVNTQVTHSALTSDGLWLATVETRYEPGLALELRLKFWNYSNDKKRFILATVIDMPHDDQVHTIKFSPESSKRASNESVEPESEVVLVSTGADRKMRLWSKTPIDSIYQKGDTWRCQNACFYRDLPCGPCSFSYDGSVLAVGFGAALTLWDVENVVLKHSLARSNEHIKFVEFGREDCCNMLMCATESTVMAWDLLKLVLSWKVDLKSALFVADPNSSFVAVFTVDNQWKILDAHNGDVVSTMNSEGKSEVSDRPQKQQVLAAVFVPRHRPNTEAPKWMRNSYLYYIDVYQELNCLEPANEIAQLPTFQLAMDKDSGTLFGSLVGAKSVREKADEEHSKTLGYGVLGARAVNQLLEPAAHTLPPVNLLCGGFLQSFVILKRDNLPDESDRDDKSEDDKTTVIASSDSEQEVEMPTFSAPTSRPKKSAKTPDRRPPSATPSESTPEPMDTDGIDLKKHFPMLDEDDDGPWQRNQQQEKGQLFVIED